MEEKKQSIYHKRHYIHLPGNIGDRAADIVATFVGSWTFVAIMSLLMAGWIVWNITPGLPHFDPPQFVLLNLCLSFIAGYTGPFVMMSQNRQANKDRKRDDLEAQEISDIFSSHDLLLTINQQQLSMLNQQTAMLEMLKQSKLEGGNSEPNTKQEAASAITAPFNAIDPSNVQQP